VATRFAYLLAQQENNCTCMCMNAGVNPNKKSIDNARKLAVATDSHGAVELADSYGFGSLVSKIMDWRAIKAAMLKLTDMAVSRPDGEGDEFEQGGSNLPCL